jgi:hypothetical protein
VSASSKPPLAAFFALTLALSLPFWAAGASTAFQLLPGLPASALGFLCPGAAAAILLYRASGSAGLIALARRAFDYDRVGAKIWFAPALLLVPGVMVASYAVMRLVGAPLAPPQLSLVATLALFFVFFIAATGEELGWLGYATDPLQQRFGALRAALLLGLAWAGWHVVPLMEAGRSAAFIAWWSLGTVAHRVIIVWLYDHAGRSVFIASLHHAMINLAWQSFPIRGSFYDPRVTGCIALAVALAVAIVWRPRTWAREGGA